MPEGAPAQGIVVKNRDNDIKPVFSTTNSKYQWYDSIPISWGTGYSGVCYNGESTTGVLEGSFTLRYNDIAVDRSGNDVDMVLRISNVNTHGYSKYLMPVVTHGFSDINVSSVSWNDSQYQGNSGQYVTMDVEYFFLQARNKYTRKRLIRNLFF